VTVTRCHFERLDLPQAASRLDVRRSCRSRSPVSQVEQVQRPGKLCLGVDDGQPTRSSVDRMGEPCIADVGLVAHAYGVVPGQADDGSELRRGYSVVEPHGARLIQARTRLVGVVLRYDRGEGLRRT